MHTVSASSGALATQKTSPAGTLLPWRWVGLAVGLLLAAVSPLRATVQLTSYNFAINNLPTIYVTGETLSSPYKLRAKVQPNFHAVDGFNNNGYPLQSMPGTGWFTVELYWVKYAGDWSTILEVGPRNIQSIYVQAAANAAPTIQWTSAWANVQENTSYYIQARGTDANGNLTQVNVWKNGVPFAFAGGGTGYEGYSGNSSSDSGGQTITYMAEAVDSSGVHSGYIYHYARINKKPTIEWDPSTPWTVAHNTQYNVRANAADGDGNMITVNIYRNEQPFAFALNGSGWSAYSQNFDLNSTYTAVTYRAEAIDSTGANSGSISRTISVPNTMPSSSWNTASITTYIGQSYNFTASASDPDGNLQEMRAYEYAWEDVSGTWVQRQNYQWFDTMPSAGGPVSRTFSHIGGSPWKWNYQYVVIARDTAGVENWPYVGFGNILNVTLDNRNPAPPTLASTNTTMTLGQSVVLSGAGSDPDGNATQQWLWYRGPDQGPDEWIALTTSSYATGTGNTVVNFSFTPLKTGTYYFKTQVNDPYNAQSIVNVAPLAVTPDTTPPNPPTNVAVTGLTSTWATLAWTLSSSNDVGEQHVYWLPQTGGTTTDILLGNNLIGVSVTSLSPGGNYRMYLKARDTSGNYSIASNEVLVATPVPVTITSSPVGMTVNPGATVTFSVAATGTGPLTYQWLHNSATLPGATNASLILTNVQPANAGSYVAVVSNNAGSVASAAAGLTVNTPPGIITHPTAQTASVGASVTFSVAATGTGPLSYQWRKNNVAIPGATSASYTLTSVQASDAANAPGYSVTVSNAVGSITSNAATLSVNTTQPVRLALQYWQAGDYPDWSGGGHWEDQEVWIPEHDEENQDFVDTDDDGWPDTWVGNGTYTTVPGHYEWQSVWVEDGVMPDGQYGSRWDTTVGTFGHPPSTATGGFNPSVTNRGYLLNSFPTYYSWIAFRAWAYAPSGNCSNFTASLYTPQGYLYSSASITSGSFWYLQFPSWSYGTGIYRVDLSYTGATATPNSSGTVSYYIPVGVAIPPVITTQPGPETLIANVGSTVTYTVGASNATGYQWQKDTQPLAGATGSSLTLAMLTTEQTGSYRVVVSNATGSTTSSAVSLTVTNEPFGDNDGDGIPNGIEVLLQTNAQNAGASDATNNTLQLKIQRP